MEAYYSGPGPSTSFLGSLISPERKMRDPGNEVPSLFVLVAKWRVMVPGVPSAVRKLGIRIETAC